jgi:hypothetical protein
MLAVTAVTLLATGCYARVAVHDAQVETYDPVTYDDNVVYYDGGGLPYYYSGGVVVYVRSSDARYRTLTSHYQANRDRYHRWYQREGHRQPQQRRPARR